MKLKILFSIIILIAILGIFYWYFLKKNKTILFLCVHNTFRSQIAETYFNKFAKEKGLNWRAKSAGFLESEEINPMAIILMKEEGIDISDRKPKLMTRKMVDKADKIIVLCKECEEQGLCVVLPKYKDIEYWRLEDPAKMELNQAREIRNKIKENIIEMIKVLK